MCDMMDAIRAVQAAAETLARACYGVAPAPPCDCDMAVPPDMLDLLDQADAKRAAENKGASPCDP